MLRLLAPLVLLSTIAAGVGGAEQGHISEHSTQGGQEGSHAHGGTGQHHATQGSSQEVGEYQDYITQYAGDYQKHYQGYMKSYAGGAAAHASSWVPIQKNVSDANAWEDAFMRKYADSYKHYRDAGKQLARRFPSAPASPAECHDMAALNEWRAAQRAAIEAFVPEDYRSFPEKRLVQEYEESRARIHRELAEASNHTQALRQAAPTEEPIKEEAQRRGRAPASEKPTSPTLELAASQAAFTAWLRASADTLLMEASPRNNANASDAALGPSGSRGRQSQPESPAHKSPSGLRREDDEERREERRRDEAQRREARREDEDERREERREDEAERREARQEDEKERRQERRDEKAERHEDDAKLPDERHKDGEKRSEGRRADNEERSRQIHQDEEKRHEERRKDEEQQSEDAPRESKAQHGDGEKVAEEARKGEAQVEQKRPVAIAPAPQEPQPQGPTPEPVDLLARASLIAALAATAPASFSTVLAGLAALAAATALSASIMAVTPRLRLGARGDTFTEQLLVPEAPLAAV